MPPNLRHRSSLAAPGEVHPLTFQSYPSQIVLRGPRYSAFVSLPIAFISNFSWTHSAEILVLPIGANIVSISTQMTEPATLH